MSAIRPSASSIGCRLTLGTSSLVCLPPFRRPANRLAYLVWHNNQFSPRTHSSGFNRKLLSISVLLVFMLRKNTRDIALNWTEREKKLHPLELLWRWFIFFYICDRGKLFIVVYVALSRWVYGFVKSACPKLSLYKMSIYSSIQRVSSNLFSGVRVCIQRGWHNILNAWQMDADGYVTSGSTEVRTWHE